MVACAFTIDEQLGAFFHAYPGSMAVCDALGLGAHATDTLREAATRQRLNPQRVLLDLALTCRAPLADPDEDHRDSLLNDLVEHIICFHHDRLRAELARLGVLLAATGPAGAEARAQAASFGAHIEEHLQEEEEELFPLVDVAAGRSGFAAGDALSRDIEHDHVALCQGLQILREALGALAWPSPDLRTAALRLLADLEEDHRTHQMKEDDILFPALVDELERRRRWK